MTFMKDLKIFLMNTYLNGSQKVNLSTDNYIGVAHMLNPVITKRIEKESIVIVCGLWKELCVYIVARKLQEKFDGNVLLFKA
ncbi:hypothetical protein [Virgibacillus sp. 6R]|uniref:hypothetical protein n=1 Tax=Virgibacillus sp. 6R TaxID=1911587 RepID=UPI00090B72BA|nr:hypothetical protein [Virgibacillus sp. 6R]API91098.1 hypothetical protein BKP57_04025 [Virgibacillus sp. 6R]